MPRCGLREVQYFKLYPITMLNLKVRYVYYITRAHFQTDKVVRKNVMEYIIALVVVKNKVRLKKCLNNLKYDKVLLSK
jgi:hypothetical protein